MHVLSQTAHDGAVAVAHAPAVGVAAAAAVATEGSGTVEPRFPGVLMPQLLQQQQQVAEQQCYTAQLTPSVAAQQQEQVVGEDGGAGRILWRPEQSYSTSGVAVTDRMPGITAAAAFLAAAGGGSSGRRDRQQEQQQQHQQQESSKVKRFFSDDKMHVARAFYAAGNGRGVATTSTAAGAADAAVSSEVGNAERESSAEQYYRRFQRQEGGEETEREAHGSAQKLQQLQQQVRCISPKTKPVRPGTPPRRPGDHLAAAAAVFPFGEGARGDSSSSTFQEEAEGVGRRREKYETSVEGIRIYYVESSSDEQQQQVEEDECERGGRVAAGERQQQLRGRGDESAIVEQESRIPKEEYVIGDDESAQLRELERQMQNVCRTDYAAAGLDTTAATEGEAALPRGGREAVRMPAAAAEGTAAGRRRLPHEQQQQQQSERPRRGSRERKGDRLFKRDAGRESPAAAAATAIAGARVATAGAGMRRREEAGTRGAKPEKADSSRLEIGGGWSSVARRREEERRKLDKQASSTAASDPPSPAQKFSRRTLHRLIMKQFKVSSLNPADIRLAIRYRSLFIEDYKDLLGVNRLPTLSGHVHTAPLEKNRWMNRVMWSGRYFVLRHGHWFWFRDEKSYRMDGCSSCLGSVSLLLNSFSIDLHARYTTRFSIVVGDWLGLQIDTSIARRDRGQWVLYFLAAGNFGEQIRLCFPDVDWTEVQSRARLIAQQNVVL